MRSYYKVLFTLFLMVMVCSCATVKVEWEYKEEAIDINALYEATVKALAELELKISQKTKDRLNATIIARDSQDKKITVQLVSITKDSTKMSIRAGSSTRASRIHQMVYDSL